MTRRGVLELEFLLVLSVVVLLTGMAVVNDDPAKEDQKEITTASGLKYIDLKVGTGDKAKVGSKISVYYTGTLRSGVQFDSNVGKEPYEVSIGAGNVIKGWEEGLFGMQKGGKRKLIVPYQLGYGEDGKPPRIPPKAELTFVIEAVSIVQR